MKVSVENGGRSCRSYDPKRPLTHPHRLPPDQNCQKKRLRGPILPYVDMPSLHFFFLTQPLAISNPAGPSATLAYFLAMRRTHGLHLRVSCSGAQAAAVLGGDHLSVLRQRVWLRFFCTGTSRLFLGSCTCWPETERPMGVPAGRGVSCLYTMNAFGNEHSRGSLLSQTPRQGTLTAALR